MTVRSSIRKAMANQESAAGFAPDPKIGLCGCADCVAKRAEIDRKYAAIAAERSARLDHDLSEIARRGDEAKAKSRALAATLIERSK